MHSDIAGIHHSSASVMRACFSRERIWILIMWTTCMDVLKIKN